MTPEDEAEIAVLMKSARTSRRGYADFFNWAIDRDLEEWGVVMSLAESMRATGALFFMDLRSRGRQSDPPDCEAVDCHGRRIAIEVTELVDGKAIEAHKEARRKGKPSGWADWSKDKFLSVLAARIKSKGSRFPQLMEPPYPGGYVVVIHTDEVMLPRPTIEEFLANHIFATPQHIDRAFLLASYDPTIQRCPYFELKFSSRAMSHRDGHIVSCDDIGGQGPAA